MNLAPLHTLPGWRRRRRAAFARSLAMALIGAFALACLTTGLVFFLAALAAALNP